MSENTNTRSRQLLVMAIGLMVIGGLVAACGDGDSVSRGVADWVEVVYPEPNAWRLSPTQSKSALGAGTEPGHTPCCRRD